MPRFAKLALSAALCFGIVGMIALGAAAQTGTAKPKPPAIVTVKKADGSTVRGVVEQSDGRQLTIKPVKANAFGDPVELQWSEIKSVSNGLTRQKARDAWRLEHKSEVCESCKGDGRTVCETCKGIGHDPAASKDCKTCKGELLAECTDKRCNDGKVPCPEKCLKLTEGAWSAPDAAGKRWRSFRVKGGTARISDGHVGEIAYVEKGEFKNLGACPTCSKTGVVTCPTCGGDRKAPCATCKANKSAADCADCEAGLVACKPCDESGMKSAAPTADAPTTETPAEPEPAAKPPADNNDGF